MSGGATNSVDYVGPQAFSTKPTETTAEIMSGTIKRYCPQRSKAVRPAIFLEYDGEDRTSGGAFMSHVGVRSACGCANNRWPLILRLTNHESETAANTAY